MAQEKSLEKKRPTGNKCESCTVKGLCCFHSVKVGHENVILTKLPCRWLDTRTNLCTIYEDRFRLNPACNSIESSLKKGGLPIECEYVEGELKDPKIHSPKEYSVMGEVFRTLAEEKRIPDTFPHWARVFLQHLIGNEDVAEKEK